jgi:putative oxidoreductase
MEPNMRLKLKLNLKSQGHWFLRLIIANVFLFHGVSKFPAAAMLSEAMSMPKYLIYIVGVFEVFAGILILLGGLSRTRLVWATRLSSIIVIVIMGFAIKMVHWGQWAFMPSETHGMGGMEFQVSLILLALYFLMTGNKRAG